MQFALTLQALTVQEELPIPLVLLATTPLQEKEHKASVTRAQQASPVQRQHLALPVVLASIR